MWRKPRPDLAASLRSLRRRVVAEGDTFFRVFAPGFEPRDFGFGDVDETFADYRTAKKAAEDYALDLASFYVGSSVFISERKKLDGVQVAVSSREVSFSFLEGVTPCR